MGKKTLRQTLRKSRQVVKPDKVTKRGRVTYSTDEAASNYRHHLTTQFASGHMGPRQLVETCWYSTQAGARGVEDMSSDPKSIYRNAGRIVNRCLGIDWLVEDCLMSSFWPRYTFKLKKAVQKENFFLPVFEVFAREWKAMEEEFMAHVRKPELCCQNFYTHELVVKHGAGNFFP